MLIGGYAVNYHGYIRNTNDMDVWLAPTNENKEAFINTLLCMNYSNIAPDVLANIIPYDTLKDIKLRASRPKDLWDIARLEELRNKK